MYNRNAVVLTNIFEFFEWITLLFSNLSELIQNDELQAG